MAKIEVEYSRDTSRVTITCELAPLRESLEAAAPAPASNLPREAVDSAMQERVAIDLKARRFSSSACIAVVSSATKGRCRCARLSLRESGLGEGITVSVSADRWLCPLLAAWHRSIPL